MPKNKDKRRNLEKGSNIDKGAVVGGIYEFTLKIGKHKLTLGTGLSPIVRCHACNKWIFIFHRCHYGE